MGLIVGFICFTGWIICASRFIGFGGLGFFFVSRFVSCGFINLSVVCWGSFFKYIFVDFLIILVLDF